MRSRAVAAARGGGAGARGLCALVSAVRRRSTSGLDVTVSKSRTAQRRPVTYTVSISNAGGRATTNVVVGLRLPGPGRRGRAGPLRWHRPARGRRHETEIGTPHRRLNPGLSNGGRGQGGRHPARRADNAV